VQEVLQHFADPATDIDHKIAVNFLQVGDDENATRFLQVPGREPQTSVVDHKLDDILYEHNGIERATTPSSIDHSPCS
jgi:hypothetical protein